MADISLEWKDDFQLDPTGDLLMAEGTNMTRQHLIRRLLSAVRSYVWHSNYGAGLPQRIGRVARLSTIRSLIRAQMKLEQTVALIPIPVVKIASAPTIMGMYVIDIYYTDAATGQPVSLNFEVPGN